VPGGVRSPGARLRERAWPVKRTASCNARLAHAPRAAMPLWGEFEGSNPNILGLNVVAPLSDTLILGSSMQFTMIWVCSGCSGTPVQSLDRGTHRSCCLGLAAWVLLLGSAGPTWAHPKQEDRRLLPEAFSARRSGRPKLWDAHAINVE
jgi:hypothetical protein